MSDLQQTFEACVHFVQHADAELTLSNALKLEIYALFKQATVGDVSGDQPGRVDFIQRAKYSAWQDCKGLSCDAARQRYIDRIEALKADHR